jgi:hypothetical protein
VANTREGRRFSGSAEGYCVPELMRYLGDCCRQQVKAFEYDMAARYDRDWLQQAEQELAEWDLVAGHFYSLDSHLMTRALVFRETLATLTKYTSHLSPAVLECYLVGSHPLVLVPTSARFEGCVWDEKRKLLQINLAGRAVADVDVIVDLTGQALKVAAVSGASRWKLDRQLRQLICRVKLQPLRISPLAVRFHPARASVD